MSLICYNWENEILLSLLNNCISFKELKAGKLSLEDSTWSMWDVFLLIAHIAKFLQYRFVLQCFEITNLLYWRSSYADCVVIRPSCDDWYVIDAQKMWEWVSLVQGWYLETENNTERIWEKEMHSLFRGITFLHIVLSVLRWSRGNSFLEEKSLCITEEIV